MSESVDPFVHEGRLTSPRGAANARRQYAATPPAARPLQRSSSMFSNSNNNNNNSTPQKSIRAETQTPINFLISSSGDGKKRRQRRHSAASLGSLTRSYDGHSEAKGGSGAILETSQLPKFSNAETFENSVPPSASAAAVGAGHPRSLGKAGRGGSVASTKSRESFSRLPVPLSPRRIVEPLLERKKQKIKKRHQYAMSPFEKCVHYGRVPCKFILNILIVIMILVQCLCFEISMVEFEVRERQRFFNEFMPSGYEAPEEDYVRRPTAYMSRVESVLDHIEGSVQHYYKYVDSAPGVVSYLSDKSNVTLPASPTLRGTFYKRDPSRTLTGSMDTTQKSCKCTKENPLSDIFGAVTAGAGGKLFPSGRNNTDPTYVHACEPLEDLVLKTGNALSFAPCNRGQNFSYIIFNSIRKLELSFQFIMRWENEAEKENVVARWDLDLMYDFSVAGLCTLTMSASAYLFLNPDAATLGTLYAAGLALLACWDFVLRVKAIVVVQRREKQRLKRKEERKMRGLLSSRRVADVGSPEATEGSGIEGPTAERSSSSSSSSDSSAFNYGGSNEETDEVDEEVSESGSIRHDGTALTTSTCSSGSSIEATGNNNIFTAKDEGTLRRELEEGSPKPIMKKDRHLKREQRDLDGSSGEGEEEEEEEDGWERHPPHGRQDTAPSNESSPFNHLEHKKQHQQQRQKEVHRKATEELFFSRENTTTSLEDENEGKLVSSLPKLQSSAAAGSHVLSSGAASENPQLPRRSTSMSMGGEGGRIGSTAPEKEKDDLISRHMKRLKVAQDKLWRRSLRSDRGLRWTLFAIVSDIFVILFCAMNAVQHLSVVPYTFFCWRLIILGISSITSMSLMLSYLRFWPKLYFMIRATSVANTHLLSFLVAVLPIFLGYTFFGLIVFGPFTSEYGDFLSTVTALYCEMFGDTLLPSFQAAYGGANTYVLLVASRVYCFSFIALFMWAVLNVALAIVVDAYTHVRERFGLFTDDHGPLLLQKSLNRVRLDALEEAEDNLLILLAHHDVLWDHHKHKHLFPSGARPKDGQPLGGSAGPSSFPPPQGPQTPLTANMVKKYGSFQAEDKQQQQQRFEQQKGENHTFRNRTQRHFFDENNSNMNDNNHRVAAMGKLQEDEEDEGYPLQRAQTEVITTSGRRKRAPPLSSASTSMREASPPLVLTAQQRWQAEKDREEELGHRQDHILATRKFLRDKRRWEAEIRGEHKNPRPLMRATKAESDDGDVLY